MLQIPSAPVQLPASPEKRQQSQFNMIGIECCFEKFSSFICNCHMLHVYHRVGRLYKWGWHGYSIYNVLNQWCTYI